MKTSSFRSTSGPTKLAGRRKPRSDEDAPGIEVDRPNAGGDGGQRLAARELEHVVRDTGLHGNDLSELAAAFLLDVETDELKRVPRSLLRLGKIGLPQLEESAPPRIGVETDDEPCRRRASTPRR